MPESLEGTEGGGAVPAETGPTAPRVDLGTVAAVTVVVYATTVFIHEAVGHGGAALLLGARIVRLTTVDLRYQGDDLTAWDHRMVAAAGTVANLLAGMAALAVARGARRASPTNRYFLWLFGHVNLFMAGGYPMALAFAGFGDWDAFTRGLPHRGAWQVGVTLLGALVSFAALGHALRSLEEFLGRVEGARWRRALALALLPYLAGGTMNTVAGLFNPEGMFLVAFSAMMSTFGGTAFLAWLPKLVGPPGARTPEAPATPRRSRGWVVLAFLVLAIDLAVLAPGVPR